MNDRFMGCVPAPLQHAVTASVDEVEPGFYPQLAAQYEQKLDDFCKGFSACGPSFIHSAEGLLYSGRCPHVCQGKQ